MNKIYEFVVAETRVVKCNYIVEAENEEEAKLKALDGETIDSEDKHGKPSN